MFGKKDRKLYTVIESLVIVCNQQGIKYKKYMKF